MQRISYITMDIRCVNYQGCSMPNLMTLVITITPLYFNVIKLYYYDISMLRYC